MHSANQSFYDHFQVTREETQGKLIYELGSGQWDIPEPRELLEKILPEASTFNDFEVEHDFQKIGTRTMLLNGRRLDHLNLIILAIRDVTEQRNQERRQQAFMGELQHRVKNILNNVGSLARQTRRGSTDFDQFFNVFMSRLAALARAQELLVRAPEEEVELADIVHVEPEAIGAEHGRTYSADGPSVRLSPRDTQAVAMALHELATNAGKYGALKVKGGFVEIEWRRQADGEEELQFHWREHGVSIADTQAARGFGSEVIEKSVPYMLGGSAELVLARTARNAALPFPFPKGTTFMTGFLDGRHILVLEDDYLLALDVQQTIEDFGGTVVGPVGRLEQAQALARAQMPDVAVLDVNLDGSTSYPLARELLAAGVAVIFLTGYEASSIEPEFADVPRLSKPFDQREGERVFRNLIGAA